MIAHINLETMENLTIYLISVHYRSSLCSYLERIYAFLACFVFKETFLKTIENSSIYKKDYLKSLS